MVPSTEEYDPGAHLSFGDVALDDATDPRIVHVNIKASKTDPFQKGVSIFLGRTNSTLCPVAAVAAYLASRKGEPGPFFKFKDGLKIHSAEYEYEDDIDEDVVHVGTHCFAPPHSSLAVPV